MEEVLNNSVRLLGQADRGSESAAHAANHEGNGALGIEGLEE